MSKYKENSPQGDPTDLLAIIADLKKRVEFLEKGARAGATAIDSGSMRIINGSLTVGANDELFFGNTFYGTDEATGWVWKRSNQNPVFFLAGDAANDQYFALLDDSGNVIMADDGAANQGLALPYVPIGFTEHSNILPTNTTTSGTFTSLVTSHFYKQHPKITVFVLARSSDGTTTGELQLRNGTGGIAPMSGVVATVSAGFYGLVTLGPVPVDGSHLAEIEIEVQARRTAGAGTIGIRVFGAYGVQS